MLRTVYITLAMLFVLAGTASLAAQENPPSAPNADGQGAEQRESLLDDRVDRLLRKWSGRTNQIQSLYTEFNRTIEDKVFRSKDVGEGSARYQHPNKARLDITGGEQRESVLLTENNELWQYKPTLRQLTVYELPPPPPDQKDHLEDGPLPFLFGSDPERAKMRYRFTILAEDERQVHVRIEPKLEEDLSQFSRAEIWLNQETFLPDKLVFVETNDNEVTYEFKQIWTNIQLNAQDFVGVIPTDKQGRWEVVRKKIGEQSDAIRPASH